MNCLTAKKLLKKVVNDYNQISTEFDQTRKQDWKEFEAFLPYIKNGEFLADLGCGNGRFYKFIQTKKIVKYIGIDNSEGLLEKARKSFPKAKFIKANLLKLPLKDSSIDIAAVIASLHHIPSKPLRLMAIREIHRTLKPEGFALITVWNLFQPKYKKYIWKARLRNILSLGEYDGRDTFIPWGDSGVDRYYYAFKAKELVKLLKINGFKIIEEIISNNLTYIVQKT